MFGDFVQETTLACMWVRQQIFGDTTRVKSAFISLGVHHYFPSIAHKRSKLPHQ